MKTPDLMNIVKKNIAKEQLNALPNGLICLKGGNLQEELHPYRHLAQVFPLSDYFEEEWYKQDKQIIYIPC